MIQNPDVMKEKIKMFYFIKMETSAWIKTNSQKNYYKQRPMTNRKIFATHIPYIQKDLTKWQVKRSMAWSHMGEG